MEATELDLIKLELRDLLASVGELRLSVNAMFERMAEMEQRIRDLEAKALDNDRRMTGWTVTPAPVWDA